MSQMYSSSMHYLKTIRTILDNIIEYALDIIAPQDPFIREIERMTPKEFIERAKRAPHDGQHDDIICFFAYHDPLVSRAILELKSYGNPYIARLLGNVLFELILEELGDLVLFENVKNPLLVPIPMTQKSERKRGFNQCTLIVQACMKNVTTHDIKVSYNTLIKVKKTDDQVGKTKTERLFNLQHCFAVNHKIDISKKDVIVFDDIMTTGATLHEAKRTLRSAGARKVILVALAH